MGRKTKGTRESYQRPLATLRGDGKLLARDQLFHDLARLRERLALARIDHREAFGVDELDVVDAEEAQEVAHVSGLRIERRAGVEAAARREDHGLLAFQ